MKTWHFHFSTLFLKKKDLFEDFHPIFVFSVVWYISQSVLMNFVTNTPYFFHLSKINANKNEEHSWKFIHSFGETPHKLKY